MSNDKNDHLFTAQELSECLKVSDRRIRQMAYEGKIKSPQRGLYDFGWAIHYYLAQQRAPERVKEQGPKVMVAWGWACGDHKNIDQESIDLFCGLFERNGIKRDEAMICLGKALAFMG